MDFFERQDKSRALSIRLTLLFFLAVFMTFLTVHVLIVAVCAFFLPSEYRESPAVSVQANENSIEVSLSEEKSDPQSDFIDRNVLNPAFLFVDFLIVGGLILGSAAVRFFRLKSAGVDGVACELGGRAVLRGSSEARDQRLRNVVEEIAIASGTPIPRVFVMESAKSVNACAIGSSPDDAAICVTRGALDYLTRDELQGMIAHEFSHIANNDVRLNMRLIGLLFGLEVLTIVALWMMRSVLENYRLVFLCVVGIMLFCIGGVGLFFGNVIRAAISRQREYLADASAVQFTRNPLGIAGALKKIGCAKVGSTISSSRCEQASHMFFGSVFKPGFFQSLYRTHPPLIKRVKALDPTFDGVFPDSVDVGDFVVETSKINDAVVAFADAPSSAAPKMNSTPSADASVSADSAPVDSNFSARADSSFDSAKRSSEIEVNPSVTPTALYGDWAVKEGKREGVKIAPRLLEPIPAGVDGLLVEASAAKAAFYSALLSREPSVCARQLDLLGRVENEEFKKLLGKISPLVRPLSEPARLQTVRVATSLIKNLSSEDYKRFRKTVIDFCAADGRLDFFEYSVQMVALRELDAFFQLTPPNRVRYSLFSMIEGWVRTVLVALAYEGEENSNDAEKAFRSGCEVLGFVVDFPSTRDYTFSSFTTALNELACASPQLKKTILQACWRCILSDSIVTERESALLSVIAAALGAPAPVWKDWR